MGYAMFGKSFLLSLLIFFALFHSQSIFSPDFIWGQEAVGVESREDYENVLSYLINLDISSEIALVDKEISFKRDVGIFKLLNGKIYTCSSYEDQIYGIFFEGEGEFSFVPPSKIEQDQLYRFYDKDEFQLRLKHCFFYLQILHFMN